MAVSDRKLRIATWNVNSARLRQDQIARFLTEAAPDALCLQEIKCKTELFPKEAFEALGYVHQAVKGQPGYNGVAILSKHPLHDVESRDFGRAGDARHIAATMAQGLRLHNFYIPAGGDLADPQANPKFAHKLQFLEDLGEWSGGKPVMSAAMGDFNIAPMEHDVWSHKALLDVVSHTPLETSTLDAIQAAGGWIDSARRFAPAHEKLYSWWSYRAKDWDAADKGRRLDHLWLSADLGGALRKVEGYRATRGWERPSDHTPVLAEIAI